MSSSDPRPTVRLRRARSLAYPRVAFALVLLDLVVIGMVAADAHGPVRFVLGLLFALTVPGWALVGLLHVGQPLLEASLGVAASLSILMLLAQLTITVGWWHLAGLEVVVGLLSLPPLIWQALERPVAAGAGR